MYPSPTLLPHYTFSYSNSIHCLLPLGPHVSHVWPRDWVLPQLSLLYLLPNFFHCLSTWTKKNKKTKQKRNMWGDWTAHSASLKKKKGRVGHTQRDTSHKYNRSLVPPVAVQFLWDRWGVSCFAEGYFSSGFLRVREHLSHNSPTQTFPASPRS